MRKTPAPALCLLWLLLLVTADGMAAGTVHGWVTTSDHRLALTPTAPIPVAEGAPHRLPQHIVVEPERRYQTMLGFGASLTDSSACG